MSEQPPRLEVHYLRNDYSEGTFDLNDLMRRLYYYFDKDEPARANAVNSLVTLNFWIGQLVDKHYGGYEPDDDTDVYDPWPIPNAENLSDAELLAQIRIRMEAPTPKVPVVPPEIGDTPWK